MATERVADIGIGVHVDDRATAELKRIEAQSKATAATIGRQEAEVKVKADLSDLQRARKETALIVKELERERAQVGALDRKDAARLGNARRRLRLQDQELKQTYERLGQVAREGRLLELNAKQEVARAKAAENTAKVLDRSNKQHEASLVRQQRAQDKINYSLQRAPLLLAKQREQVRALEKDFARAARKAEALDRKRPLTREGRMELSIDRGHVFETMERIKAELELLGRKPPVHIRIDTDPRDASLLRRKMYSLRQSIGGIFEKFGKLGETTFRLGPITTTITGAVRGLSLLGPIVTSLAGSLTALVGVLGTGVAGAALGAAGAIGGLGISIAGMVGAIKPAVAQFKLYSAATKAYNRSVALYGKDSDKTKDRLKEMRHAYGELTPAMRQGATELKKFSAEWQSLTGKRADRFIGSITKNLYSSLRKLAPTIAGNTNRTFDIIQNRFAKLTQWLSRKRQIRMFDSIGESSNQFLKPALIGVEHLVKAFLHLTEASGRLFAGRAGQSFRDWAAGIDKATQPSEKLDRTIQRLGNHAADVFKFMGAFGRLFITIMNRGANSGDRMVKSMTDWANKKNEFFKGPKGKDDLNQFFNRSEQNTRKLVAVLGPLVKAFLEWSNALAPISSGMLSVISVVSRGIGALAHLTAMQGPLKAFGATLAGLWAVNRIAGFISKVQALGRAIAILAKGGGLAKALGEFKSGPAAGIASASEAGAAAYRAAIISGSSEGAALLAAGQAEAAAVQEGAIVAGSTTGAGEMRVGITSGAAVGAGELRTGITTGAAVGAGELRAGVAEGAAAGGAAGGGRGLLGKGMLARFGGPIAAGFLIAQAIKHEQLDFSEATSTKQNRTDKEVEARLKEMGRKMVNAWGPIAEDIGPKMSGKLEEAFNNATKNASSNQQLAAWEGRFNTTIRRLAETAKGKKFIIDIATRGGPKVKQTFAELTKSAIGRKILFEIAEKGGPHMRQLLMEVRRFKMNDKTFKIIANSKNADEAIKRLESRRIRKRFFDVASSDQTKRTEHAARFLLTLRLGTKKFNIIANVTDAVHKHGLVKNLPNVAKVLAMLGNNQKARAAFLATLGLSKKEIHGLLRMIGNKDHAQGIYDAIRNAPPIYKNVYYVGHVIGAAAKHFGGFATGGMPAARVSGGDVPGYAGGASSAERQAQAIVDRADKRSIRTARSQRVSQPTFLVGEEDRPEYVIATNPAYRRSNTQYLQMAAHDLGFSIVPSAGGHGDSFADNARQHPKGGPGWIQAEDGSWVPPSYYGRTSTSADRSRNRMHHHHVTDAEFHLKAAARDVGYLDVQPARSGFTRGFHGGKHRSVGQTYQNIPLGMLVGASNAVAQKAGKKHEYNPLYQWGVGDQYDSYTGVGPQSLKGYKSVMGHYPPNMRGGDLWFSDMPISFFNDAHNRWKDYYRDYRQAIHEAGQKGTVAGHHYHGHLPPWLTGRNSDWDDAHSHVANAKKSWQIYQDRIQLLGNAMSDADSNPRNTSKLFNGKEMSFDQLKKLRIAGLKDTVTMDNEALEHLRRAKNDLKTNFGSGPWYELAKNAFNDMNSRVIKAGNEINTTKHWNPSKSALPEAITPEELIQHYTGEFYSADSILNDPGTGLLIQLAKLKSAPVQTPGIVAQEVRIDKRIADVYKTMLDATKGTIKNPATRVKEPMSAAWQNTAQIEYNRVYGDYLQDIGQQFSSPEAPETIAGRERGALYRDFGSNVFGPTRTNMTTNELNATVRDDPNNPVTLGARGDSIVAPGTVAASAYVSDAGGQFSTRGGQFGMARLLSSARVAGSPRTNAAMFQRSPTSSVTNRHVNVTNNFLTQPTDPLTWSQGVKYDLSV